MTHECHITVPQSFSEKASQVAKVLGWKTSEIARDPIMGEETFFYLTRHADKADDLFQLALHCESVLRINQVPTLRTKIERIVFDTKTGVNEL